MTHEERQLLLIDISARLPYGVYVHFCNTNIDEKLTEISLSETIYQVRHNGRGNQGLIKPYLRHMSSMTKEEKKIYQSKQTIIFDLNNKLYVDNYYSLDYLNSIHVDYRGLIYKGLALEASEEIYNIKKNN